MSSKWSNVSTHYIISISVRSSFLQETAPSGSPHRPFNPSSSNQETVLPLTTNAVTSSPLPRPLTPRPLEEHRKGPTWPSTGQASSSASSPISLNPALPMPGSRNKKNQLYLIVPCGSKRLHYFFFSRAPPWECCRRRGRSIADPSKAVKWRRSSQIAPATAKRNPSGSKLTRTRCPCVPKNNSYFLFSVAIPRFSKPRTSRNTVALFSWIPV